MKVIHIITKGETFTVDEQNRIGRPSLNARFPNMGHPSDTWTLRGAMEFKFGVAARTYTPDDIRNKRVPWKYRNGKQRCFVMDYDHGVHRVWMSPDLIDVMVTEDKPLLERIKEHLDKQVSEGQMIKVKGSYTMAAAYKGG